MHPKHEVAEITDTGTIVFKFQVETIQKLKERCAWLGDRTDKEIRRLYSLYSDYCGAGWLILTEKTYDHFEGWFRKHQQIFR